MKNNKNLYGFFTQKIDGNILRQTLRAYWPIFAALVLSAVLLLVWFAPGSEPEPVRYELETAGSEIDFAAPEIIAHSAGDGIAVVRPAPEPVARPARAISDPAEIWVADPAPTHGGFTLPVAMDDDSIGILTIPDIGVTVRVYEAESEMEAMERGAAHFRSTSAWFGNIGISAHNINFNGTPGYFLDLHKLKQGAVIRYETALGIREYAVDGITEISEMDWSVLERTDDNRLTLITCITNRPTMRLCVVAKERHP